MIRTLMANIYLRVFILIQNKYYEKFLAESAIMFLNKGLKTPQMLK